MSKVAVIGAGVMGLACAYDLLKQGHEVDIYEADDRIGGMAAHFDFAGLNIERYYHFICKPDQSLFELLKELGIEDKLCWTDTRMGYYFKGRLHEWGNPIALLKFPELDFDFEAALRLACFCFNQN
ncbi:MAG: FAD-dependent oxidoreductase [Gammaproteobacteria bacterium]|nr:FAD-dependent oxidoreductase [Gammaproteobacteria bacterium]